MTFWEYVGLFIGIVAILGMVACGFYDKLSKPVPDDYYLKGMMELYPGS